MARIDPRGGGGFGRSRRGRAALAFCLTAAGCYAYTEASPAVVTPGTDVRIRLESVSGTSADETLLREGRPVFGKLLEGSSPDTLLCSVLLNDSDPFSRSQRLRGTMRIPVAAVDQLEVRQFQKGPTAALVGAGALVALVVLDWAFNVTNPGEGPSEESPDVEHAVLFRSELFRWHW